MLVESEIESQVIQHVWRQKMDEEKSTIQKIQDEFYQSIQNIHQFEQSEARLETMERDDPHLYIIRKTGIRNGWSEQMIVTAQACVMAAKAKMYEQIVNHQAAMQTQALIVRDIECSWCD